MVGHEGSSAGSYLTDPTPPIPSHCASIVVTSTLRVNCVFPIFPTKVETRSTVRIRSYQRVEVVLSPSAYSSSPFCSSTYCSPIYCSPPLLQAIFHMIHPDKHYYK